VAPDQVFDPDPGGADAPVAGFYSLERRGKVALPVRIWFGQPDGEDRSPRWQMMVGDRMIDESTREHDWDLAWDDVWPQCAKSPIHIEEYNYRLERVKYAKSDAAVASDPWARRSGKIDLLTAPIPE
jgi:hypothetical protein